MSEEQTTGVETAAENTKSETPESTAPAKEAAAVSKKKGIDENKLELCIAIFLGLTAILTAWASWIGSLHGGNQATNYTESNNLSAMGNSMYNEAAQKYLEDAILWNTINDYLFDKELAEMEGDSKEAALIDEKIQVLIEDNTSEEFAEAINWALEEGLTPFDKEGLVDSYYTEALATLDEADELLAQGKLDNRHGDAYGLVTVLYSVVLFLLGIVGIFKKIPNRLIVLIISIVLLLIATIYMMTIPLPTDFSLLSFFVH